MVDASFECKHCKRKFISERTFMKHECPQMIRARDIQSPVGQAAYGFYKIWLEKQRRKAPPIEVFLKSSYYTQFMKFAEYVRELNIPDPVKYAELMINNKISPTFWRRPEAYQIFLEWVDKAADPYQQAAVTVETILALAEGYEIQPGEVFSKLKMGEMLELINQRRLSPWLLFCSKKFKEWVATLHDSERQLLMKSIGIHYWAGKLEREGEVVRSLKEIAEQLGV